MCTLYYSCTRFNSSAATAAGLARRLLGEYGGIEADQQQQEAADSNSWLWLASSSSRLIE